MSSSARRSMNFFLVVFVVLTLSLYGLCDAGEHVLAASSLDGAEALVCQVFETVLEAEEAGANVSGLMADLNEAGALLAEAEILRRHGDLDEAADVAEQAVVIANDVESEALELKNLALVNRQSVFWFSSVCSLVGVSVFLIVLFFVWGWFRRVYVRRLLRMKPEVV
jgi:hypothetical protein